MIELDSTLQAMIVNRLGYVISDTGGVRNAARYHLITEPNEEKFNKWGEQMHEQAQNLDKAIKAVMFLYRHPEYKEELNNLLSQPGKGGRQTTAEQTILEFLKEKEWALNEELRKRMGEQFREPRK